MRALPTGLIRRLDDPRLITETVAISEITHADPRCTAACVAFNTLVAALLEAPDDLRGGLLLAAERAAAAPIAAIVANLLRGGQPLYDNDVGMGFVLLSLERALFVLLSGNNFAASLEAVIRQGGDTDTNAAIAGALLGAREGRDAIPAHWLAPLHARQELEEDLATLLRGDKGH